MAADDGYTDAMQVIAACYFNGEGVPKDLAKTIEWTRRAADAGNVVCQLELVKLYTHGEHVEPDVELALQYARMLAKGGQPELLEALETDIRNEEILAKTEREGPSS